MPMRPAAPAAAACALVHQGAWPCRSSELHASRALRAAGARGPLSAPRAQELAWLKEHVTEARVVDAPFRVVVMHQPRWGWLVDGPEAWIETANEAGVDLGIAGHRHRFSYTPPGPEVSHDYHLLLVGQDQVAMVDATSAELTVTVTDTDGTLVHTLTVPRSSR